MKNPLHHQTGLRAHMAGDIRPHDPVRDREPPPQRWIPHGDPRPSRRGPGDDGQDSPSRRPTDGSRGWHDERRRRTPVYNRG